MYFIPFTAFKKDENGHTYGYNNNNYKERSYMLIHTCIICLKEKFKPKNNGYVCYFFRVCECDTI